MINTQDESPKHHLKLERVGIKNLKTLIRIDRNNKEYRHIPKINIFMDLEEDKKGVHMSRFIESITEILEDEVQMNHKSLEQIGKHILEKLKIKHRYVSAEIEFQSEIPIYELTPVSKKDTIEIHDIKVKLRNNNGSWIKVLEASVIGNTACPHALAVNKKGTHIQRATGTLRIEADFDNEIDLEEMINVVEKSFSAKVYTLLKTEDESFVVDKMYENPFFVEDVCRNILSLSSKKFKKSKIHAECLSYESIHRHDVFAEGDIET
ncbi:MAG: GTP cyclohydrolase I FolE2 [Candidatus Methanofastidiosa archaeon]|nr:GTP cyclohydrolase I FolE2 [Candidatus Methanofastidiosa archaeon]